MSCVAVESVAIDVPVKFGDSRSNHSQDIRDTHFVLIGLKTILLTQFLADHNKLK